MDGLGRSGDGTEDKITDLRCHQEVNENNVFTGLCNKSKDEDAEDMLRQFLRMELKIY